MRLKSVYIKNFRNINELTIDFSKITVLIGENSIGKTNILMAIYKILKMEESPRRINFTEEDFYFDESSKSRSKEIIIQLNFDNLDENDINAFLMGGVDPLNKRFSIRLEARFEEASSDANVEVYFYREDDQDYNKGEDFRPKDKIYIPYYYINAYRDIWKETEDSKGDLKQIFKDHNKYFLKPVNIQASACIDNIEKYLEEYGELEEEKLIYELKDIKHALKTNDYKSIKAHNEELERLISLFEIKNGELCSKILTSTKNIEWKTCVAHKMQELGSTINDFESITRVKSLIKENISLFNPPNQSIDIDIAKLEEADLFDETKVFIDNIPVLRQGSGFQNSFVIAIKLSRLLARICFSDYTISNLIIAIEEPEAHMHPHLQRALIKNLKKKVEDLSNSGINTQMIITTHSPSILSQIDKTDLRMICKNDKKYKIIKFDSTFAAELCNEIKPEKIKHLDYIFRIYPEIFLSKGVIIVEGRSEFGAFPEFVKKIPEVDLDKRGITIIYADGKDAIKPFYIILRKFIKCIAIRDNEGENDDADLIESENGFYCKTVHRNFEEEIVNSVDNLKLLKILFKIDPDKAENYFIDLLRKDVPETRPLNTIDIINQWDTFNFCNINIDKDKLVKTLEDKYKTALIWSLIAAELKAEDIPQCYKDVITKTTEW